MAGDNGKTQLMTRVTSRGRGPWGRGLHARQIVTAQFNVVPFAMS